MPYFKIFGASKDTAKDVQFVLKVPTERIARLVAKKRGVCVSKVLSVDPPKKTAVLQRMQARRDTLAEQRRAKGTASGIIGAVLGGFLILIPALFYSSCDSNYSSNQTSSMSNSRPTPFEVWKYSVVFSVDYKKRWGTMPDESEIINSAAEHFHITPSEVIRYLNEFENETP